MADKKDQDTILLAIFKAYMVSLRLAEHMLPRLHDDFVKGY